MSEDKKAPEVVAKSKAKPKVVKLELDDNIKTIKLDQGFEIQVDRRRFTDIETFDLLGKVLTGENPFLLPKLAEVAFGVVERDLIFAKLREEHNGFVPTDIITDIIIQVSHKIAPN